MRRLAFVGVILLSVTAGVYTAQACSCMLPPPPPEALADAAAVFVGEVINIDGATDKGGFALLRVRFRIESTWKGDVEETVEVRTASHSAACGYPFKQGNAYLVYAHEHEGLLRASLCSRTTAIENADADLEALGASSKPGQLPSDSSKGGRCGGPTSAAAMQVVVFTLLGAAVLRRRG